MKIIKRKALKLNNSKESYDLVEDDNGGDKWFIPSRDDPGEGEWDKEMYKGGSKCH